MSAELTNYPQPAPAQISPYPPNIPSRPQTSQIPNKRGFAGEHYAYRVHLSEFPFADDALKLLSEYKHQLTGPTVEKLEALIYACASEEPVLTNFPTMRDVALYKIGLDIEIRRLKLSVPRIDSQNQIFHYILSLLEWTADPRFLRGYQAHERNKQNEERIYSENIQKMPAPEQKSHNFFNR